MNKEKSYFTKYIHEKGEIKEGDNIATKLLPTVNLGKALKEQIDLGINDYDYVKIKLSLCSRDIQVGDKVRMETGEELITYNKKGCGNTLYTKGKYELEVFTDRDFKIIGEVSPEAIWVKEGMEFDEDEIRIVYDGTNNIVGQDTGIDAYYKDKVGILVQIKCNQCNTFH